MVKISCYKTKQELLAGTFCQLAEKCYYSFINTCVITNNSDFTIELDRVLWTYSKKHFIPHATNKDPFPEEQPIYISDSLENPNNSKIIILVNLTEEKLLEIFSKNSPIDSKLLEKVLIIFDDTQKTQFLEIKNLLLEHQFIHSEINLFQQSSNRLWQAVS